MKMQTSLTIDDLNLSNEHLIRRVGDYGIYFRHISPDICVDTEIFRYMKLPYFTSMIRDKVLYMPNRHSFSDLQDGRGLRKHISKHFLDFGFSAVDAYKNRGWRKQFNKDKEKSMNLCISCWTTDKLSDGSCDESFLMWKAYAFTEMSCRIKTTIQQFIYCITDIPCDLVVSDVEYNNTIPQTISQLLFRKTNYYKSENEIRVVALIGKQDSVKIQIDPYTLIQGVKTSPFLNPILENYVIGGLKRSFPKLSGLIEPSKIMEYPYV